MKPGNYKAALFFLSPFFIATVFVQFASAGDSFLSNKSLEGKFHYGYVWAHRQRMQHLVTGHTTGFELSLDASALGEKEWHRIHGYPQTGISIMHFDLANSVLGKATAMIGYINFPLVRSPHFLFSFQAGGGLAYVSRRFHHVSDYKNMGIGSHVNSAIRVNLQTRYQVSNNLFLHLNYGVTHFSNTAYRLPNLGVNNVSLSGGLSYSLGGPQQLITPEITKADPAWIAEIVYGTGVKENYPPDGKQFFAHTIYIQFLKPLGHKSNITIGADGFYDLSLLRFVKDATSDKDRRNKIIRSGIHAGYEMQINRVRLLFHMGYYLLDHTRIDSQFYNRYGVKYDLGRNLFLNLTLKTHFARADFAEVGLGWKIKM